MSLKLPRNWDFSTFRAETAKIARSKSVMPGEGSSGGCRPGSPKAMERPLKSGWLKKQRSIVKNWQTRYFVLRGNTLYYHKDDKEGSFQGFISLKSSQVCELPSNPEEPGKYLFEIISGGSGDRERDACVLMANSQNEMEEWVRTIRRVIGASSGGAVFGKSLEDTIAYEQKFGPRLVPILIQKCAEFILEHGLGEEGIFRLPGQDNQVKRFRDAFDAGERPSFPRDTDVHTVASLFKLYLRELPEPVVPWTQYQYFLDSILKLDSNSAVGTEKLEQQIALLPRVNYNLLSYICRFLYQVQQNSKVNKMSVENLATVIGVNLLKPQIEDPITMMKSTPQIQKLMTILIKQHKELFPPSKDVAPSPPPQKNDKKSNVPRSFVGWDVAEGPADIDSGSCESTALTEITEEEDSATTSGNSERQEEEGAETKEDTFSSCLPLTSSSSIDLWGGTPRKRTQTLPAFTSPMVSKAKQAEAPPSPPLTLDTDAQKSTFSEDIFKILDLQRVPLFTGTQKEVDETDMQAREGAHGSADWRESDGAAAAKDHKPHAVLRKTCSSYVPLSQSPKSDTVDKNRPSEPATRSTGNPHLLTVGLGAGQELPTHSIASLLKENSELSTQISELQAALEVERRKVVALETRLRSTERSRDEALQRNCKLDCEIQSFLSRPHPGPPYDTPLHSSQ